MHWVGVGAIIYIFINVELLLQVYAKRKGTCAKIPFCLTFYTYVYKML